MHFFGNSGLPSFAAYRSTSKVGLALHGGHQQVNPPFRAELAKKHSSEAFYALDDPLEAAVISVLFEILKEMGIGDREKDIDLKYSHSHR